MKRVIRRNCFESNSSSMHSVVVTKNEEKVTPDNIIWDRNNPTIDDGVYICLDGKWSLQDVDKGYGRYPFRILTSFEDKFKYSLCEYLGDMYEDDPRWEETISQFYEIAAELIPGFKDFYFHTKDVDIYLDADGNDIPHCNLIYDGWNEKENRPKYIYKDKDGNKHMAMYDEDNYIEMPAIGMIDHQSMGLLKNFLKEKNITLKEFLTNKKYIIVIDGDEMCDFERYLKAGLINKDFITEIYSTSGEDIEYKQWLEEQKNEESN